MKFFVVLLVSLLFSITAFSASYQTQIHSIDKGQRGEAHLVVLANGHVAFLEGEAKSLLLEIEESMRQEEWVEVRLDQNLNLISIQTVSPTESEDETEEITSDNEALFSSEPSIISLTQAQSAFRNMRTDYQNESQCYNRAHIWSYEEQNRTGIKSNKLFLFFTSKYIRAYRYKWWFHVTPMVYVNGSQLSNWKAMDKRYTEGPLSIRTWTNVFMHNNANCPIVSKYSSYRNNQQKEWCYLIPTSMYFWQPRDIERQERTGYVKTNWFSSEINHAYWEAF